MLFRSIALSNLLSFREMTVDLRPLNVLIGANSSGKSNLISAIGLLQAAPGDLQDALRRGGGAREWICKNSAGPPVASLLALIEPSGTKRQPTRYFLAFGNDGRIEKETLRDGDEGRLHFERDATRVRFYKTRSGA